ncbi:hypothetical protein OIO90_001319 [Microbotryomycetes sp. JL221]|nr:hypothetical protein OIO90_001319 [Microbotryomycetes sp. JL221]
MAAVCVSSPTETVFTTITSTSLITDVDGFSTSSVFDPEARTVSTILTTRSVGGQIVTFPVRTIITGATVPTRVPIETTRTSLILSSSPVSTLFASCEPTTTTTTTTTTSSSTTTTTTSTSSSTTTTTTTTPESSSTSTTSSITTTTTPAQSTITEFTTIPRSSSTASSSSNPASLASNRPGSGSSSSSNTGAIAGGVVGGIAGLALLAALIFFCCKKRRNSDKDFDFGDDTWNPAGAAYTSGAATSGRGGGSGGMRQTSSGSVLRSSRYSTGSSSGAAAAAGLGAAAGAGALAGGDRRQSQRRNRPADEQDNYYASVGIPPREETATPMSSTTFNTAALSAGMAGVGATSRVQPPQQQRDPLYGGLADTQSGRHEGGWGVANQMRNSQQFGRTPAPVARVPPPAVSSAYTAASTLPSIPYRLPSPDSGAPLSAPGGFPGPIASPAPSHRSIPGMGGMAWLGGGATDERRSGQLRVMNEEPFEEERLDKDSSLGSKEDELNNESEEQMRRAEEERRFGTRNNDAYDGLTEGLGRTSSVNGATAPTYRTYG